MREHECTGYLYGATLCVVNDLTMRIVQHGNISPSLNSFPINLPTYILARSIVVHKVGRFHFGKPQLDQALVCHINFQRFLGQQTPDCSQQLVKAIQQQSDNQVWLELVWSVQIPKYDEEEKRKVAGHEHLKVFSAEIWQRRQHHHNDGDPRYKAVLVLFSAPCIAQRACIILAPLHRKEI